MLASRAIVADRPLASADAIEQLRRHAIAAYPEECVGVILQDGRYRALQNIHPEPRIGARPDPHIIARLMSGNRIRAYCHSHPDGPDCPSEQDMRGQQAMAVPWIIVSANATATMPPFVFGDQVVNPDPLVGREFRHGVQDCYGTIRAWGRAERGIMLPDFPRQWEWWIDGVAGSKDLYRRHFADAGFRQIDPSDSKIGDVWLAAVRYPVPNHAGVYIGEGLTLHHPASRLAYDPQRLSRREPVARWVPMITHWLRRDDWCR